MSQEVKQEQIIAFGSRINNPVQLEVLSSNNRLKFVGINHSGYPYELEVKFKKMYNLSPNIGTRQFVLSSGENSLFTLTIKDEDDPHDYSYSVSYTIGVYNESTNSNFPYIIPLSNGTLTSLSEHNFKVAIGDTIFAARKGTVAVTSKDNGLSDRIITSRSLEILHSDGTVAVYESLYDNCFVSQNQTVYPGQPLGLALKEHFTFRVFEFVKNIGLRAVDFTFTNDGKLLNSKEAHQLQVNHSNNTMTKELSKRELKKFSKKELY